MTAPEFFSFQSTELDEARSAVHQVLFPASFDLLDRDASYAYRFDVVRTGPLTAGEAWTRAGLEIRIPDIGDCYFILFPVSGGVESVHRGVPVTATPTLAAVYQPVGESVVRLEDDADFYDIAVDRRALEERLEALLGHPVSSPVHLGPDVDLSYGPGHAWARLARLVATEAGEPSGLLSHPMVAEPLREAVLNGILLSVHHPYRAALAQQAACSHPQVNRVVDAIRARPEHPFTTAELAEIAGVGVRALEEGFQRHVAASPMEYLRRVRLARAVDDLRGRDPRTTSVPTIALKWGFARVGDFVTAYATEFGETPWQTLNRRPGVG
jgi:AraC-like DNA-binding protein